MRLPSPHFIGRDVMQALGRTVLFLALLVASGAAMAQNTPDRILATVIRGLQTGQINQSWFGPQLLQTIHQQTNGTFVYQPLVQLGQVMNIQVTAQQPMAQGVVYAMRAFHANGATDWQMGISRITNRIEYLAINVASTGPTTPTTPTVPAPPPVATEPERKALPFPGRPEAPPQAPQPPRQPPVAGPPMPTPSPTPPAGGTGGSEACRLYPNLC